MFHVVSRIKLLWKVSVYLNFDKISACHPAAAGPQGR